MLNGESRQPCDSEDRPEQEGPPDERYAPRFGERGDSHRGRVGIGAGKLVPELRRAIALSSPVEILAWRGARRKPA